MTTPLRKVTDGQEFSVGARTWNAFIDAAVAHRGRNRDPRSELLQSSREATTILIRNDSGEDVPRFGVLGIDTIVISPDDNLAEFQNNPVLSGAVPSAGGSLGTHTGKFVITTEPIEDGKIGRAVAVGIVPVQIDGDGEFADITDADVTQLTAGDSGLASILYAEPGSGTRWALVRLGGASPATSTFLARITGHATLASGSTTVGGGASVTVAYKFKHAWTEMERTGDTVQVKSGGRSGTTTVDYAINEAEDSHTVVFSWGQTINAAPYPVGHRPKAVGGANNTSDQSIHSYDVLVEMREIVEVGSGLTKYRFNLPWFHSGSCT